MFEDKKELTVYGNDNKIDDFFEKFNNGVQSLLLATDLELGVTSSKSTCLLLK